MMSMTNIVRYVQRRTGFPRFQFITPDEIRQAVIEEAIPEFNHYFPYKTYYTIYPDKDSVDQNKYPGLFKIEPEDCPPEKIYDVGMVFCSSDLAVGGYPRDLSRTVYGGQLAIGALMYNQLNINLMSMTQAQQITCEFIQPNYVQCYPKRRFSGQHQPVIIELMVSHSEDLKTVPNAYEIIFRELCDIVCKRYIYDKYKDYDDENVAGHPVRTKIDQYSDMESKLAEWREKADEESFRNPDRLDLFIV